MPTSGRLLVPWLLVAAGLGGLGCAPPASSDSPTDGSKEGPVGVLSIRVVRRPVSPVEGIPGAQEEAPASGVRLRITREGESEAVSVTTDDQGQVRKSLRESSYRVELIETSELTKDLPRTVTLTRGQETHLEVSLDSGIR